MEKDKSANALDTESTEKNKILTNPLSISQIESDFFSKLRAEIKDGFSESLDYSLLEDQVLPETYESSPDVETRPKRMTAGLSNLLKNMTIAEKQWQDEISDESFLNTEKLIRGPEYQFVTPETKMLKPDISTESVTVESFETVKEIYNDLYLDSLDGKIENSAKKIIPNITDDSLNVDEINNDSYMDSLDKNNIDTSYHSPNLRKSDCKMITEELNKSEAAFKIPESVSNDSYDSDTPVFNDTIEEIEHYLKQGRKQAAQTKAKIDTTPKKPEIYVNPPNTPSSTFNKNTPSKPLPKFKIPSKPNTPMKSVDTMLKPRSITKHRLEKYDNIISPIRYYIKNSPTIPMVQNVSPSKDYWNRCPPRNLDINAKLPKLKLEKENNYLPEKAYKSPKVTNIVEKAKLKHLPKNNSVALMADNLPKVVVIKHMKREKANSAKSSILKPSNQDKKTVEDSFAHLPVKSMDVSYCVGHKAARSHTLK